MCLRESLSDVTQLQHKPSSVPDTTASHSDSTEILKNVHRSLRVGAGEVGGPLRKM